MKKIAVIDLGSNSIRMSIFEECLPIRVLSSYRKTIKLSEGMTDDMLLKAEAQMRAALALLEYKKLAEAQNTDLIIAVATAAVRKAKNQSEFLSLVKDLTGINLLVISGETEASLDRLAISRTVNLNDAIMCDIGGGSCELVGISPQRTPMISIPHGCRGVTENFFKNSEDTNAQKEALAFFDGFLDNVSWLDDFQGTPLIGIGGTLRTLAKFDLSDSSRSAVESHTVSLDRLNEILDQIAFSDISSRALMTGIGEERADIILGGIIILKSIVRHISPPFITVTDAGLREGILYDHLEGLGIL